MKNLYIVRDISQYEEECSNYCYVVKAESHAEAIDIVKKKTKHLWKWRADLADNKEVWEWIIVLCQKWRVIDMTHIETLVMNEIRKALEDLERQGVGYIDCEQTGVIHYNINGRNIRVQVSDTTLSD